MQEMWCRKGTNGLNYVRMSGIVQDKIEVLVRARIDPSQIKEVRMSGIAALGKWIRTRRNIAMDLNKEEYGNGSNGPESLEPKQGTTFHTHKKVFLLEMGQ